MNKLNKIRVALFEEKAGRFTGWVAQCLDFDLIAQGQTIQQAQESFQRAFKGHVALAFKSGKNPFSGIASSRTSKSIKTKKATDLGKIRIAYSQLESLRTVPLV